ncbi:cytochrome b [Neoroseomonas lacus]|uniref:Type-b cytochrome n=1 Tax=Neoroseomonas lacus TaxID=287609 RepID=A0A917KR10_9PROT|nr:cytochrome b/b6 domain-containing protein [Neoroseomonas lacus]GGJ25902.1 type-b cytochrome [Neoroseomonas lacus]
MTAAQTHSAAARAMHWASAGLILVVFAAIWMPVDEASDTAYAVKLMVHRSAGVLVWLLTLVRLVRRGVGHSPALPMDVPRLQRIAARLHAAALYLLLLAQPLFGLIASQAAGNTVRPFGLFAIPTLVARDRALAHACFGLHEAVATLLLVFIGAHVAAALHHHYLRRDGVLVSMLPGLRRLDARHGN